MSTYNVVYLDEARDEVYDAVEYYRKHSLNAAVGFESSLSTLLDMLADFPNAGRVSDFGMDIRQFSLRNYPYTVYYRVDDDALEVVAISLFNTHRDPKKLELLLKQRTKEK